MRIGVDLLGSDNPPRVLFQAVLLAVEQLDESHTFLVFATHSIVDELKLEFKFSSRIKFKIVSEEIFMNDDPLLAVRRKKGSSIVIGMRLIKRKIIDAFVSAGNTGALITSAKVHLSMLPGIKRPALLAILPTEKGTTAVIDVGGNIACKAEHLVQFAHLGVAYQFCAQDIKKPIVGLLNIGVESRKGTLELRQAYQNLKEYSDKQNTQATMDFIGNVEGRDVFQGKIDVLVTDGFTGNILLKTSEGLSFFIFDYLQRTLLKQPSKNGIIQHLTRIHEKFNPEEYPGAIVCGIDGVIVKCHGNSSARAMLNGILGAVTIVRNQLITRIKKQLQTI